MATIVKRGKSYRAIVSQLVNKHNERFGKTFKTRKDAQIWALQTELDKNKGLNIATQHELFSEYFENWVLTRKKYEVRPATYNNYFRTITIVRKLFARVKMSNLCLEMVQHQLDIYGLTHSQKTTHEVLLKIRACIRFAVVQGSIARDFTSLLKAHGKTVNKRNIALSISEMKILRKFLLAHSDNERYILFLVALETGARRGELLGLKKVDLKNQSICINRSISPTSDDQKLKNRQSKRSIKVTQSIWQLLINLPVHNDGYLFATDGFHQSQYLGTLLKKLGLPKTTFHGLRDTHASFLFSQDNIDIAYISNRLGHDSISTTQDYYVSLMPEKKHQQDADALDLLNGLNDD